MAMGKIGALVIYHGKSAVIENIDADKFEIRIAGGDRKKVRAKDMEFLHPGPVTALPPAPAPRPELAEIAELMGADTLTFTDFTELLFGSDSAAHAFAAWEILSENLYFTGSVAAGVAAAAPEKVAAALAARQQKSDVREARAALLERIRTGAVTPDDYPGLREIEAVALGAATASTLMHELGIAPLPEKAHALLLKLGVWELCRDPWPHRFKVALQNPALPWPSPSAMPRRDLTAMTAYAIDDAESHDPDDAVSYADGLLWVHVADPSAVVSADSELDREAAERGGNLYLPDRIIHMLPTAATAELGLGLNPTSPALSFAIRITADGTAELEEFCRSTVRVTRLDYDAAAAQMTAQPLAALQELLERFRARRIADGAVLIQLPEVKIRLRDGARVEITPVPATPVRELVANAMLAAGSAAARFAAAHELPMPFVVQAPPEYSGARDTLVGMFELRKSCQPGIVTPLPGKHSGLGLEPYVRMTSPLRRYSDLLAHRQFLRFHDRTEPPFGALELDAKIAAAEAGAALRRKLERQSNDYWTQVYFAQHPDWQGTAIPVFRQDERLTWLIPELAYEFKNRFPGRVELGIPVKVALSNVDPATLSIQFRLLFNGSTGGNS